MADCLQLPLGNQLGFPLAVRLDSLKQVQKPFTY